MVHSFSAKIDQLFAFLNIDTRLLESADTVEKVSFVADYFIRKIYFDTAKNIEVKTPLLDGDGLISELLKGNGANCIEQSFLFRSILSYIGVPASIFHADVYDYDQNAVKPAFISIVHVPLDNGFMHIDTVRGFYFSVDDNGITSNLPLVFRYTPTDQGYSVAKFRDGNVYWKEHVLFDLPEQFRKDRLLGMIGKNVNVTPYGTLAPIFSMSNPWRAIFYDLPSRTLKLVNGENTRFIDVLELDDTEDATWLSLEMKERIFRMINHIVNHDVGHFELIDKSKHLFKKIEKIQ